MLVDSHCHLDELLEPEKAIVEAKKAGVGLIVSNSVDLASMEANLALSQKFSQVKACFGLHPANVLRLSPEEIGKGMQFIRQHQKSCLGLGETGLDFKLAEAEEQKLLQERVFKGLIALGKEFNKPVIVHSRRARKEVLEIIEQAQAEKVLLHWFVAKKKLLEKALQLDCFISLGPSLLFNEELKSFAEKIPLENLLLETDCPVAFNGKPSQPSWIKSIAEKLAEIKDTSFQKIEEKTLQNFERLFRWTYT